MIGSDSHAFPLLVGTAVALTAAAAIAVRWVGPPEQAPAPAPASAAAPLAIPYGPATADEAAAVAAPEPLAGGATGAGVHVANGGDAATATAWLTAAGVPSTVAPSAEAALAHPFVVWTGTVADGDVEAIERVVTAGAVVVVDGPSAAAAALAGASGAVPLERDRLALLEGGGVPSMELAVPPSSTTGWQRDAGALARFADGTAAIAVRRIGNGLLVVLGVPLERLVAAPARGIAPAADLAPAAGRTRDALALVARALYALTPTGVALGPAPDGAAAALVLQHPVVDDAGLAGLDRILRIERDRGVRSTVALAARTAADDGARALDRTTADAIAAAARDGFDVAAAGVAATPLTGVPVGSGTEAHPGYAPSAARGGATFRGETRVARHLLGTLAGAPPAVFAPPVALAPAPDGTTLDIVAADAGYAATSAVAAGAVGGSLPYRAATDDGRERALLRLPIAFDDAAAGAPRVDQRAAELDDLVAHARATGAPATVRISPAGGTAAAYALERLLATAPTDLWTGDAATFARAWSARYGLRLEVEPGEDAYVVRLVADGEVPGQTLLLPFAAGRATVRGEAAPLRLEGDGRRIALPAFRDRLEVLVTAAAAGA